MMLRPLGDRILVLMDESLPNVAGIFLNPDVSKWREAEDQIGNRGTVVAIGPGKRHPKSGVLLPMCVAIGDVVRFSELQFPEHKEDGKRYALISEQDVTLVEDQWTEAEMIEAIALTPKEPWIEAETV